MTGFASKKRKIDRSQEQLSDNSSTETNKNLPNEWRSFKYESQQQSDLPQLLFGVNYSEADLSYDLYITDMNRNVWFENITRENFQSKANSSELSSNPMNLIFTTITDLFKTQFINEQFPISVQLNKSPDNEDDVLHIQITQDFQHIKLNWSFTPVKLPAEETLTILSSIIFQLSSIINTQNHYQTELLKQIDRKDSTIRYYHESLKGIRNGEGIIKRYGGNLQPFQQDQFKRTYFGKLRKKSLPFFHDRDIIGIMNENEKNGAWEFNIDRTNTVDTASDQIKQEKGKSHMQGMTPLVKDEFQSFYNVPPPPTDHVKSEADEVGVKVELKERTETPEIPPMSPAVTLNLEENLTGVIPAKQESQSTSTSSESSATVEPEVPQQKPIRLGFMSRKRKAKRDDK